MARDGYPFIAVLVGLAAATAILGWWYVAIPLVVLAAFVGFFFRDPDRQVPADARLIVSPADGRIIEIRQSEDERVGPCSRVSIFLSVFDVHINRLPVEGVIEQIRYRSGKFLAAFNSRSSSENEQNTLWIGHGGGTLRVTQIAGLIARRIVCWKNTGDSGARGERFGLIRFGSRVDVFLPRNVDLLVKIGDRVRGGETPIGRLGGN